jgi:hypothetical protein
MKDNLLRNISKKLFGEYKIRIYPKIPKDRKIAKELQKLLNYNLQCHLKDMLSPESYKETLFSSKKDVDDYINNLESQGFHYEKYDD